MVSYLQIFQMLLFSKAFTIKIVGAFLFWKKFQIMGNLQIYAKMKWLNMLMIIQIKQMVDTLTQMMFMTKVLQNNKVLLSSTLFDGMYYELTYNEDKNELYIDCVQKVRK